jgi:hypothetical protein
MLRKGSPKVEEEIEGMSECESQAEGGRADRIDLTISKSRDRLPSI